MLDRAYYHDEREPEWVSMPWVSLGWMRADGGRDFKKTSGREPPEIKDGPSGQGTIFLADFRGPVERADTVRYHPDEKRSSIGLVDDLRRHRTAIGYTTTALVRAGLEGLEIQCKDRRNIMWEENWLELLPYADWHHSEIESGLLWDHLRLSQPQ